MELGFGMFFTIIGIIFFILSIYEELTSKNTDDEQEKSDNAIIIFLFLTVFCLVIGGIGFMFVSETYYSVVSDTVEETLITSYRPIGYAIIIFAFIPFLMLISKIFSVLGAGENE